MKSKIYLFVILIVLLFGLINNVSAADNTGIVFSSNKLSSDSNLGSYILINSITKSIYKFSAKYKVVSKPKIANISISSNMVKAGRDIRIKFYPNGYVKSVYSTIDGEKYYFHNTPKYNFNKSRYKYWYYDLSTKGFYTGNYTLKIRATDVSRAYLNMLIFLLIMFLQKFSLQKQINLVYLQVLHLH